MATSDFRKAAVLLMSLSDRQAVQLLGKLASEQAAAVSDEMAEIGRLDRDGQEAVIREFVAVGSALQATSPAKPQAAAPFWFLHNLETEDLLTLVGDEHPQTIALIFSHLPAGQVAETLDALPPKRQTTVIGRIATMDRPSPEIIRDVADAVRRRLINAPSLPRRGGMANVVKMLNAMRPPAERRLLDDIAQAAPDLLRKIRRAMFGADVAACDQYSAVDAA